LEGCEILESAGCVPEYCIIVCIGKLRKTVWHHWLLESTHIALQIKGAMKVLPKPGDLYYRRIKDKGVHFPLH